MSLPAKRVSGLTMCGGAMARLHTVASVGRALRASLGGLLRKAAREQLVEIDRGQHEVREAALRHQLRYGHARVREQYVRADGADGAALVVGGQAAHLEQTRLLHFDQERGDLALL